ncbi:MAG: CHAT domain-containing protein [Candidatus Bathyarchaeota archaeon]
MAEDVRTIVGLELNIMKRAKLLILECISEIKEGLSEGRFLYELMRILGYQKLTTLELVDGPKRLIEKLENNAEQYVHISAHGNYHKTRGTYLKTERKGRVYSRDLSELWAGKSRSKIPELVVISACEAGHIDMVRTFSNAGCRYCLAPLHEPLFADAAVFLTLFYRLLIGEKNRPWIAYKNSVEGLFKGLPTVLATWNFYEWGEKKKLDA